MKGIRLISVLLIVSGLVSLVSAQWEEEIESFDDEGTLLPPEAPLLGRNTPPPPQIGCEDKCTLKCSEVMRPLVTNVCLQLCKMNCRLLHMELLYDCTNYCVHESMPASLMSDQKETEKYADS